jgi:hypothetical protein
VQLRVRLTIPDPQPADAGSRVRATIVDTSRADALHPAVAEATTLAGIGPHVELLVDVPDAVLQQGHRYSLQAHLDHEGTGDIKPGDLIITENVPLPIGEGSGIRQVEARLTRV